MYKGFVKLISLTKIPRKKLMYHLLVGLVLLFLFIQLFIIPWQTGFKINWEGQQIPIHLGDHPIWAPPNQMVVNGKVFKTEPIIDTEELLNRLRFLITPAIVFFVLRIKTV